MKKLIAIGLGLGLAMPAFAADTYALDTDGYIVDRGDKLGFPEHVLMLQEALTGCRVRLDYKFDTKANCSDAIQKVICSTVLAKGYGGLRTLVLDGETLRKGQLICSDTSGNYFEWAE